MEKMNPNLAKRLFEEGGILIFLGVPVGTEFGIDLKSWNTDENFRGLKMIPPGNHFIFYNGVNSVGDVSPRSGFFQKFQKGEIIVRKWDEKQDDMSNDKATEEEVHEFRRNIKTIDSFLGPYPYDIYEKWINLTESITDNLINNMVPLSGIVRSALELVGCSDAERPRSQKNGLCTNSCTLKHKIRLCGNSVEAIEDKLLPHMKPKFGTDLRLTVFPDKNYPEGSTPSDITHHSLDSSYLLEKILSNYEQKTDILGELEFTFICFLVGHSLEAFEQWKKLLSLFCSCETAIMKYRKLYNLLLNVVKIQVVEIPEEFLADIVSNNNFFYVKIRQLFQNIQYSNVDGQLKSKMNRLKEFLSTKYLWDFNDLEGEDEEDAPVVVDTQESFF